MLKLEIINFCCLESILNYVSESEYKFCSYYKTTKMQYIKERLTCTQLNIQQKLSPLVATEH